jgi:tetratricopeptide (TPR) repeat protein
MHKITAATAMMLIAVPVAALAQMAPAGQPAQSGVSAHVKALIDQYNTGNYADAAYKFFDISENDPNQANQLAAEYFAGASLLKMKLYQPAYYYFSGIVKTGPNHPFFDKAAEGLIEIADGLKDDLFIPELLMKFYTPEFAKLQPEILNRINYIIGELANRKMKHGEAVQFLNVIPRSSAYYTRASYLKGIILLRSNRIADAQAEFESILSATKSPKLNEYQQKVRDLAIMALARLHYRNGDYKKAVQYYEMIPRFSDNWFDSLFESGWAFFQLQDFGFALGRVHTLFAPNYLEVFQPETYILRSTIYFYACLYDESKANLELFYKRYKDMADKITPLLTSQDASPEYYFGLVAGAPLTKQNEVPLEIRKHLRANPRFKNFVSFWLELERERAVVEKTWGNSRFASANKAIIQSQSDILTKIIGRWTQQRLQNLRDSLVDFTNQAQLIDFETVNEQRKILTSADRAKASGSKPKLGRPEADIDKVFYWEFNKEYWVDELGYYYFTLRKECK